ncbi:MAG: hypothetical protein IJ624_07025 [Prevotella sp.]|nr:hypothetical protein [Prevotella sp.]
MTKDERTMTKVRNMLKTEQENGRNGEKVNGLRVEECVFGAGKWAL